MTDALPSDENGGISDGAEAKPSCVAGGFGEADPRHCWHSDGLTYTSYPPQYRDICCHCGGTRWRVEEDPFPEVRHGPYLPR